MATCKSIQDLILTDYMDDQLQGTVKASIDQHLLNCPACQSFAKEVKEQLQTPFKKAQTQEVSPQLWTSISNQILQEQEVQGGFWQRLTLPKLIPAFVSIALVLFVSSTILINQQIKQASDQEVGAYITYVLASAASKLGVNNDLETPIEKVFL